MKGARAAASSPGRAGSRRQAGSASTAAAAAEDRKPRQAVVVVHGMGEQKPLETLRGFVEAVWGSRPTAQPTPGHDDVWLVPDTRAGLSELARITTRRSSNGARTDFFELYWSDLLVGNTLAQIRGWVTGLLLRWPHQVPRETFSLWIALWVLTVLLVALAAFVGLSDAVRGIWDLLRDAEVIRNGWAAAASVGLTAALYALLWLRLSGNLRSWHRPDEVFLGIWSTVTPRDAAMSVGLSRALALLAPLVIGVAAFLWFPWMVLWAVKPWALILVALITIGLSVWVVPVFGDVARYVRTSPDAVSARAAIRERGVELLRALHGAKGDAQRADYDPGEENPYDRIVVVGHSLGSIVAYDILRLFWEERGPTRNNPASAEALKALRAMDEFCRQQPPAAAAFNIARFRELQGDVAQALAAQAGGWRVSDFVTLGSPLTHSEFLVSRDRSAFEERKAERMFPTCPPMMEPGKVPSFLYSDFRLAHHAAMFAAMRWTNLYDPRDLLVRGDFISGPCRDNFGPGVLDVKIRIDRGGWLGRIVTHADYWNAEAGGTAADAEAKKLGVTAISTDGKAHLTLLRKALALR